MFCSRCQKEVGDAKFCPDCGSPTTDNSTPANNIQLTPATPPPKQENKWYRQPGGIILLLIFFFPVGLYLMWKYTNWSKNAKIVVSAIIGVFVIISAAMPREDTLQPVSNLSSNADINSSSSSSTTTTTTTTTTTAVTTTSTTTSGKNEDSSSNTTIDSDNPLMNLNVQIGIVKNGFGEKIGNYAYVTISKEALKEITGQQLYEFAHEKIDNSGYNWFTIACEDDTGIQFPGSMPMIATYGVLDDDHCIATTEGHITLTRDNEYTYEKATEN